MPAYLPELTVRLATGLGQLPAATRRLHSDYLLAAQRSDGGFAGREGESDLYYTSFALRGLAILGELHGETAQRAATFLRNRLQQRESIVDFFSLIYGGGLIDAAAGIDIFDQAPTNWRQAVADFLHTLRRPDGGFAKALAGAASSTYHTFLVLLCLELIEQPVPEPDKIVAFLHSQQADDGGFREIRASKRGGTNPTAAAIASLRMLGVMDETTREDTIDFLAEMQTDEGGLRANTRIPIADLLSTFTGLLTLQDLNAEQEIDLPAARRYVRSLTRDTGGFHGAAWDQAHDVEYSFYGLGCLALLGDTASS